jgi:general secretion pathway protein D
MLLVGVAGMLVLWGPAVRGQEPPPPQPPASPPPIEPPAEGEPPLGDEEAMVLNFERADIREVIHSLATALGLSYTIDPRIEGQVTIRTTGKIARQDLLPLFNQILRNNGIAAVKVGDIYQILPVAEAKTRAIIPTSPAERQGARAADSFVIEIISLRHVSPDEMANILTPFITPGGEVLSFPRGNVLVVTDLRSNIARLRELVEAFDTNVFRDLHARVFKVEHGEPTELANEILGLLAPYGVTPTGEGEGGTFVIPLDRLSSIVVIAADPTVFIEFERWLKMLDIPPDQSAGRQTFVYNVENAKAADLAAVLNELFGGGGPGGAGPGARGPAGAAPAGVGFFGAGGVSGAGRLGAGRGRGGLGGGAAGGPGAAGGAGVGQQAGGALGGAGAGAIGAGRAGGGRLGGRGGIGAGPAGRAVGAAAGVPAAGVVGVSLPGGPAGAAAPGQPAAPPPVFKQEVRIVADDVTNSLVILATKRDFQLILDVLKRIDVMPRQVLLEVTIAEVALTKNLQFGIQWAIAEGKLSDTISMDTGGTGLFRLGPTGLPVGGFTGEAARLPGPNTAFAVISDREHFNLFINAMQALTHVKMLSAPHVIAADNREAHILVGQSIPILTSTSTPINQQLVGTVTALNTIQYRDTGNILTILPQVNSKGLVNMQIRQEVSNIGESSFGSTNSPSFVTREAETTVVVQDGHTVLIGGIISDDVTHTRRGTPFVMNIPVIGRFFRTEGDRGLRTELIVLITPYVIRSTDEARDVTETFSDRVPDLKRLKAAMQPKQRRRLAPPPEMPPAGEAAPGGLHEVVPPEARP